MLSGSIENERKDTELSHSYDQPKPNKVSLSSTVAIFASEVAMLR